ncbi:MAG: hypothetical protein AMJ69_01880 [Gammaproteobacteria bacterium SG8_47]|nr:MAG: hypothetical protein AMJ69_01880 [Gammaproteobacteria bacterium SG8_47]
MTVDKVNNKALTAPRPRAPLWWSALGICILLAGCSSTNYGDLEEFVADTKASTRGKVDPLPEVQPYETFAYAAQELRDPFSSFMEAPEEEQPQVVDTGIRPDVNRRREALEEFPLDSLKLVGQLEKGGTRWALVAAPDNTIHRITPGNYLGQNYGEVKSVTETSVELTEIVPNGLGGWIERQASLTLPEE